jgi:hypothetical protein
MDKSREQLSIEHQRQSTALCGLNDEVMSMLHAWQLRHPSVDSQTVIDWLRLIYDEVQAGLGKERHFAVTRKNDG